MDLWTSEKLIASELFNLNKQQTNTYSPSPANANLASTLFNPRDKTALVPRADQENSDVNTDLEANNNNPNDDPSSSASVDTVGGEGQALLYNDRFIETVGAITGLIDHIVSMCLRHLDPVMRSFASLLDAFTALLHYLPDLSKDVMNFVNRLFDSLLRFVSDFFAEAVPRTIESVSSPLGSTGVECGKAFVHLITMTFSTLVKLVKMILQMALGVLGVGMIVLLVVWFTGGKEVVRALLVVAPGGKE